MNLLTQLKKQLIPKKLWILRLYMGLLTFLAEIILIFYIGISIYNIFTLNNVLGDLILGYAGLYLVSICLVLLFVAQVVSLFLNVHDNIEDIRNKTINPEFSVDLDNEKESSFTNNFNSIIVIATIFFAILLALINLNRQPREYQRGNSSLNYDNETESSNKYKIGDEKDGGIVFDVDLSSETGLIVDKQDLGGMSWEEAIKACENKGDGWRLPTKEELIKICNSPNCILDHAVYWSSTPSNYDPNYAWYYDRGEANGSFEYEKSQPYSVRAVKSFYIHDANSENNSINPPNKKPKPYQRKNILPYEFRSPLRKYQRGNSSLNYDNETESSNKYKNGDQ